MYCIIRSWNGLYSWNPMSSYKDPASFFQTTRSPWWASCSLSLDTFIRKKIHLKWYPNCFYAANACKCNTTPWRVLGESLVLQEKDDMNSCNLELYWRHEPKCALQWRPPPRGSFLSFLFICIDGGSIFLFVDAISLWATEKEKKKRII